MLTASASWPKPSRWPNGTIPTTAYGNAVLSYNLNPYPETNSPIKTFDRSLTIAERVRVAAGDYQAKAGITEWGDLL